MWNQTRFVCVGSTRNKWYCALRSKVSSSLKLARAARYSSFGSGPTTGAQNSNPSARQAPSSFVPMPAVKTSLRARDEVLGLDGKVGREEQGLLVDAPVRKSIGRETSAAKV